MPVTTDDFIRVGTIDSNNSSEIELRCAIRSLYYGIFHQCSNLQRNLPHHSKGSLRKGIHDQLIGYFSDFPLTGTALTKEVSMQLKSLGYLLRDLKSKRNIADYELEEKISSADYLLHNEQTKRAIKLCESLVKNNAALS